MTEIVKRVTAVSEQFTRTRTIRTTAHHCDGVTRSALEGIFIGFDERLSVLQNFGAAITKLDADHRARSMYLSKFMAAVGAGLFDAALNYLWDETISELRRRVVGYDLSYFFDIAVQSPERRKQLKGEDDPSAGR